MKSLKKRSRGFSISSHTQSLEQACPKGRGPSNKKAILITSNVSPHVLKHGAKSHCFAAPTAPAIIM
jgi:hypothetical protein